MEKLFQKVDTVFVTVENMDKTRAWYQKMLDLELIWDNEYISVLSTGTGTGTGTGTSITLMLRDDAGNKQPLFNFLTPDIEKAHKHLKEKGVEVEPIIEEEDLKTFDFIDPEGSKLNVCYLENQ